MEEKSFLFYAPCRKTTRQFNPDRKNVCKKNPSRIFNMDSFHLQNCYFHLNNLIQIVKKSTLVETNFVYLNDTHVLI